LTGCATLKPELAKYAVKRSSERGEERVSIYRYTVLIDPTKGPLKGPFCVRRRKKMATLRLFSSLMKGSEMSFDYEPEFQWQEDAACRFQPYTLFEIAGNDSKISEGLTEVEVKDLNDANFKRAKEICNTCPVWDMCYTTAELSDFDWSVRAGILPGRYNPNPKGRPPQGVPFKASEDGRCSKGHDAWKVYPDGHRRCRTCKNLRDGVNENAWHPSPDKPCKRGHEGHWGTKASTKTLECKECRREDSSKGNEKRRMKRQAEREAAKLAS
jgi:hypothetical protein